LKKKITLHTASFIRSLDINILYSGFLAKKEESEDGSLEWAQYIEKVFRGYKVIESVFTL
jgi:hypothetical protein